jgi:ribosomal protein L7/L12
MRIAIVPKTEQVCLTAEEILAHLNTKINYNTSSWDSENRTNAEVFLKDITGFAELFYRKGMKIHAIKLVKYFLPIGLREAKEYVESEFSNLVTNSDN